MPRHLKRASGLGRGGSLRGVRMALLIGITALAAGCATTSPFNQGFFELETPHFSLMSSLGESATIELARNLEFFHAGVVDAVGLAGEPESGPGGRPAMPRTQVFAFDDRSVERPFAVRGEPTQILNRPEGMIWVFRAGRSFDARASDFVRHEYAHQLIRDRSPTQRPLWYEEGVAQMAGTVEEAMDGVRIGRMIAAHRQLLLGWRRSTLAAKMRKSNLANDSDPERRLFEAQTWAIAHTLRFADDAPNTGDSALDRYRRTLDEGSPRASEKARDGLGMSDEVLTERVYQHMDRKRLRVRLVKVEGWEPDKLRPQPLSLAAGRARLASLALELGRPGLAEEYFERALGEDPNYSVAQAGLAVVAAWEDRGEALDEFASAALASNPQDPEIHRRLGMAYQLAAQSAKEGGERERRIVQARAALEEVLRTQPRNVEARIRMGRIELIEAEGRGAKERFEGAQRATEWFEAAGVLRPGSLMIELEKARAEQLAGFGRAAELRAEDVISRTHSKELEGEARALLEARAARD